MHWCVELFCFSHVRHGLWSAWDRFRVAREEVRLSRAFGSGTVRKGKCRRERGVEVAVREQQGRRMKCAGGLGSKFLFGACKAILE